MASRASSAGGLAYRVCVGPRSAVAAFRLSYLVGVGASAALEAACFVPVGVSAGPFWTRRAGCRTCSLRRMAFGALGACDAAAALVGVFGARLAPALCHVCTDGACSLATIAPRFCLVACRAAFAGRDVARSKRCVECIRGALAASTHAPSLLVGAGRTAVATDRTF